MVAELSARHELPREIVEGVSERTGGVPLFVEEVTQLLLERDAPGRRTLDPANLAAVSCRAPRSGWALRARSHRLARFLDAISFMRYCATSPKLMSRRFTHHWIGLPTPICCLSRALRLRLNIVSSTR